MENLDIHRVKELFLAASDLPPDERAGSLDAQEDLDAPHREWVEGQLFQLENGRARLAPRGIRPARPDEFAEVDEERDEIERYKLLELIGEGGCGRVWMADQLEPVRRRVAIKVIKLGMDSKQVIARFEAERQALAMMDHPHIARIFDGGVTGAGRPFFAMELVRGLPITEYCDQNRLGIRERLELMAKVCQAVQHAHLKGVIHRDLKPSNVLITLQDGEAVPKVIDFGIAKTDRYSLRRAADGANRGPSCRPSPPGCPHPPVGAIGAQAAPTGDGHGCEPLPRRDSRPLTRRLSVLRPPGEGCAQPGRR